MKKLVSIMMVAAMSASMLAGCGSSAASGDATATTEVASTEGAVSTSDGSTLRINLASEPNYLDPALISTVDGGTLATNSFSGLFMMDENNEIKNALCDGP